MLYATPPRPTRHRQNWEDLALGFPVPKFQANDSPNSGSKFRVTGYCNYGKPWRHRGCQDGAGGCRCGLDGHGMQPPFRPPQRVSLLLGWKGWKFGVSAIRKSAPQEIARAEFGSTSKACSITFLCERLPSWCMPYNFLLVPVNSLIWLKMLVFLLFTWIWA